MSEFDEIVLTKWDETEVKLLSIENDDEVEFVNDIICTFDIEEEIIVERGQYSDLIVYTETSEELVYIFVDGNKVRAAHVRK